jgi:chemotaxis protein methyltransferase WspC
MDWNELEARLAQAIGLDAQSLGSTVFRQAVDRRMDAREVEALPAYCRLLDSDALEPRRSSRSFVVRKAGSSGMHAFEVWSTLLRRCVRREPRVLSVPCAGGEEPYSIVMCLREAGLGFQQFQVDAADISRAALQKAYDGVYGLRSIRVVPPAIQDRYFRVSPDSVEVLPEIRQAVRFNQANIVAAPSVLRGTTYDAVFCRNLFIYLTKAARQQVMQDIARSLSRGGLLFVGHAEMNQELEAFFEPLRQRGAFGYCRRTAASPAQTAVPRALPAESLPVVVDSLPVHVPASAPLPKSHAGRLRPIEAPSVAAAGSFEQGPREHRSRVDAAVTTVQSSRDELVREVSKLSNASRYPEAIEICERQIRQNGPSPQVYHVMGMVLQAADCTNGLSRLWNEPFIWTPITKSAPGTGLARPTRGEDSVADRFQQRSQRAHDRSKKS